MFDPIEGAYFTYVKNTSVLGVGDDADSIQYTGGTSEVSSASFTVSHTQGSGTNTARISAFNIEDAPQGRDFVITPRPPSPERCRSQSSGNPSNRSSSRSPAGCLPSRTASTISGASSVSRSTRLT